MKNYPPDSKKDGEAGSWRIAIKSPKGSRQLFLHVLWTRDPKNTKPGNTPVMRWNPRTQQLRIEDKALLDFAKRRVRPLPR